MKRKGITPVIDVVLLLLITVGAVASAWGLYQQITSDQSQVNQLNQRQKAENTQITVESVYKSDDGYVNVSLRNNGGTAVNLTKDVDILVSPPSSSQFLSPSLLTSNFNMGDPGKSGCFGGSGTVLTTDGNKKELQCNTSVEFPAAGQEVRFRLSYKNVEGYNWDFSCLPSSSGAIRCG
ncbi:MAG: hypothetical protein ABEJ56_04815 [Candidatus Nanohaloarchaea archaeon]